MNQMLFKGQHYTLDILKKIDEMCRNNNIQYTLLFTTLLSQYEEEGKSAWLENISIGLLYPDYLKLLDLIAQDKEGKLYVFNRNTSRDFNAFYTQIHMESKVTLTGERLKDKPYYDYFIRVYPIIYAGDTWKEYQILSKKMEYFNHCLEALAPVPFAKGIKGKIVTAKKQYWYNKRKKEEKEMNEFFASLLEHGSKPTKYVFIPCNVKQTGIMCFAETYEKVKECPFKDMNVLCIEERKEWLHNCYHERRKKEIMGKVANRAVLDGPETIRRVQLIALEILCEFDRICKKHEIPYIISAGTLLGAIRHKGFIPWDDDIDVFILNEEWQKFAKVAEKELDKSRFFLRTQETDIDNNLVFGQIQRNDTIYVKAGRDNFNTHRGIAMDILPFFNSPDTRIMFWVQNKLCRFFKTMTWAHMGSGSEKRLILGAYYRLLAKVSNKKSYQLFNKFANMVKESKQYLVFLCVERNPYHKGFNQRKYFEDLCEVEFEGHMFPAPREYDLYLRYLYGDDYMKLPVPSKRVNHHLPGRIELNGLYDFDKEGQENYEGSKRM